MQDTSDENTIRFTDLSYFRPEVWHWDFDDGMTSDTSDPKHYYEEPGWYHVCLTVSNEYATDSICRWVEVKDITSIEPDTREEQTFIIQPNPFVDYLEILPKAEGYHLYNFTMMDMHGRHMVNMPMTFPGRIKLGHLPPGMYFISLHDQQKEVFQAKVMKLD